MCGKDTGEETLIRSFLSFDKFIFPRIAWGLHLIGQIVIVISTIVGLFSGVLVLGTEASAGWLMIAGTIIGGIFSAIVWRLVIELWTVAFSIDGNLRAIREQGLPK